MKIIFAGTPDFAACALQALIAAGHDIALVLTQPDRPAGRGMKLTASPVKVLAEQHGIRVYQPEKLRTPEQQAPLAEIEADVMIVAAYGLILPQAVLNLPKLGCLNIHGSLLPRWRGAAPIHRAILAGDTETGITIMQMDAGLDTGDMLSIHRTAIEADDTTASLHDKLADQGAKALVEALENLPELQQTRQVQPEAGVTYADKLKREESQIDWHKSAAELDQMIRAFNPFPSAQTLLTGQALKIWQATVCPQSGAPGTVLAADKDGLLVACGSGSLRITELQKAGSKRVTAAAFLSGNSIEAGLKLGE
ncbi:methionyl-tRNA formyltransferase [Iodobacter fluviatilis]|uniref:Methionyl-tRNA formyltransferase n=1 Tax=Iodobacter fluviatilis TaxID=537 RepID=A0A377Q2N7_9NEIS|nr:methionyl-tRNA formyltransferase [Iodobacter fluviatilis]TCU90045.1 methionyl-tRNA formyltransferase [Iodobacter fluviatilis]STQ89072.1 Methionyl-tRNA formyltransferase [Iodobacter fluviatilis]